ncbi:MAG: Flp family type IVb pilin [Acidobacteriota bacterium]|nr:Flp family type IVb pilin [Acidobacteriota bacterium]
MKSIKTFLKDETGLELSEYAVAAAIVVAGLVTAFSDLGTAIKTKITALKTAIS